MKRWKDNWDAISPIFKFSTTVRTVIYTTNAIESLNSTYRKLNRQRSVFPSDTALLKALYLATFEATKKWISTIRNWTQVYGENRLLLTCHSTTVIYKTRVRSLIFRLTTLTYHRRILFTDFFSQSPFSSGNCHYFSHKQYFVIAPVIDQEGKRTSEFHIFYNWFFLLYS